MADREVDFLLVGGGMASAHCAAELRKRGAEGSILLVGREPEPPYERPPLSKEYLRGEASREDAYVNPPGWYEENGVELLTGVNVMSLDPEARTAKLQGGEEVGFGKALLATGAMVNILRVEGAENEGIHYLRAFGNSDAIRADAEAAEHVVLIGGSYIGTEVAASLTREGRQVHDRDDGGRGALADLRRGRRPLVPGAARIARRHGPRRRGAGGLRGRRPGQGGADQERPGDRVRHGRRRRRRAPRRDARPARRARGRRRDRLRLEAGRPRPRASTPPATAAPTTASSTAGGCGSSTGTWRCSRACTPPATCSARTRDYDVVPYFFSDLADWASLEYVGPAAEWDEEIWRGDRDAGEFSVWYLKDGRVAGALSVGRSEDLAEARRLLADGVDVSAARDAIADPDSDLGQIS